MTPPPSEPRAIKRYYLMQLARVAALAVAICGILILGDRIDLPAWLGYVVFAIGAVGFFYLPTALARRWRSEDE